jgi:hypothetical protein
MAQGCYMPSSYAMQLEQQELWWHLTWLLRVCSVCCACCLCCCTPRPTGAKDEGSDSTPAEWPSTHQPHLQTATAGLGSSSATVQVISTCNTPTHSNKLSGLMQCARMEVRVHSSCILSVRRVSGYPQPPTASISSVVALRCIWTLAGP